MSKKEKVDLTHLREDFPIFSKSTNEQQLIYLDTAATAQKPHAVIDSITDYYSKDYGTVNRAVYELAMRSTEKYNGVREKIRNFINAERPEEIIFTRGTTESINLLAHSLGKAFISEGDEILISEMEHHSNILPWQFLCESNKAHLKIVPIDDDGNISLDQYKSLLSKKTKLVSVAHISNVIGLINPIQELIDLAHEFDAKVFLDGAQAASHHKIDVRDLDVDFYAFSGHKAYGPTGVGILYGKYDLLEALPPFLGGGDMIQEVTLEKATFQLPPLKFEAGTPHIAGIIGLGSAIDYLCSIGVNQIFEWEQQLVYYALDQMKEIDGLHIIGASEKKSALISFYVEGVHPLDMGTLLGLNGVALRTGHLCAQPLIKRFARESLARVSFGIYNNYQDVDLFIHKLKKVLKILKH